MDKKIIATLIVLLFCAGCLGIASAENSTNGTTGNNESPDISSYIHPISITGKGIEFSDGFTGFCLDSTKDSITTEDGFASQKTSNDEIQNYVKLAIIEAYKQGCENDLAKIIASFADGSYKNSNDKVITTVLKSQDPLGDNVTVELEDSIEATFEFELLKDVKGKKSDCLAYNVSLKEMPNNVKLTATSDDNATGNGTDDGKNTTNPTDNKTDDKQDANKQKQDPIVNETNQTIVNKTNTVIINENNTTIINQNNTKLINETNDTPQNATIPDKIMKTVGNPIFLLIVVIAIAAIVAVVMRRKGQ